MNINKEIFGYNTDLAGLENFVRLENLDSNLTFKLQSEKDLSGKDLPANIFWLKIQSPLGIAEAKIYVPNLTDSETLVLFEPGMPGDSVKWMEERYSSAFVNQGITLVVMRHLGTRLKPHVSPEVVETTRNKYIHCFQRVEKNPAGYSEVLGNLTSPCTIKEMANEAAAALTVLGKNFSQIKVVGHSLGALFLSHSLNSIDNETQSQVTHFLSLAGAPGGLENLKSVIKDYEKYLEGCQGFISMEAPSDAMQALAKITQEVKEKGIPSNIMAEMVLSPSDEYLPTTSMEDFQQVLGGRGLAIYDRTQYQEEHHDLQNLQPETLLRLLNLPKRTEKKSKIIFNNKEPKK